MFQIMEVDFSLSDFLSSNPWIIEQFKNNVNVLIIFASIFALCSCFLFTKNIMSISVIEMIFREKKFETYKSITFTLIFTVTYFFANLIFSSSQTSFALCFIFTTVSVVLFSLYELFILLSKKIERLRPFINRITTLCKDYQTWLICLIMATPVAHKFVISYLHISIRRETISLILMTSVIESIITMIISDSQIPQESTLEITTDNNILYYLRKIDDNTILCGEDRIMKNCKKLRPMKKEDLIKDSVSFRIIYPENTSENEVSSRNVNPQTINKFICKHNICDVDLAVFHGNKILVNYLDDNGTLYLYSKNMDHLVGSSDTALKVGICDSRKNQYFSGEGIATLYTQGETQYEDLLNRVPKLKRNAKDSNHIIRLILANQRSKLYNYKNNEVVAYSDEALDDINQALPNNS